MSRAEANVQISNKEFESVKYAHSAAVSAGEVIVLSSGLVGVAAEAGDASESITYYVKGVFQFPIASGVSVTQFQQCYWDVSENNVIVSGAIAGDPILGMAIAAGSAAGGYVSVSINDYAVVKPEYVIVGYATVASNAGTGGTVAVAGALTTDHVQISASNGWTSHTAGGPSCGAVVSSAGVVTYTVGGTGNCGTAGGLSIDVIRAA
jgi:predicted RecA/RadA family phage recombinase